MSQASASPSAIIDCFACRAIGTGAFAGLGLFSIYTARSYGSNRAISAGPGAIWGIRLAGYAFLAAAAMRWTAPMRAKQDERTS